MCCLRFMEPDVASGNLRLHNTLAASRTIRTYAFIRLILFKFMIHT